MHPLPLPASSIHEIYEDSYSKIQSTDLKQRHVNETANILASATAFTNAAENDQVDRLRSDDFQTGFVSEDEMSALYKRVQGTDSPGRPHYDKLIVAAPHNRCPYCGERRVKSIDHYLPKKPFSSLAVTPANMVPACSDCNHAKGSYRPSGTDLPVIHPYFDRVEKFSWLYARIEPSRPPSVHFEVRSADGMDQRTRDRLQKHFEVFKLDGLYQAHSGQTLNELDYRLPSVFANGGRGSVRNYLRDEASLRSIGRQNSWQRALFNGLADSEWYCSEYFA